MELPSDAQLAILIALYAALVAIFFGLFTILPKKQVNPDIIPQVEFIKNRKDFIFGGIIGIVLGFIAYLPFFLNLENNEEKVFGLTVQSLAITFYLSFALIILGTRIYTSVISNKNYEKRKFISDGIFIFFLVIQFVLFFIGKPGVFLPSSN